MDLLEAEFVSRCKKIDDTINSKADKVMVSQLNDKVKLFENFKSNHEKTILMKESYDKRINVLIHGVQEDPDNAWENRETTIEKFQTFLKNGLKIPDQVKIKISDIHRLPQYFNKKNVRSVHRPIINKLQTWRPRKYRPCQQKTSAWADGR